MKTIGLLSSLLVVLAFATLSITTPVLAKAPYSTTDVLLTGLSNAGILDVDNRALVYFAESFNWRTLPDSFGNQVPLADVVVKYFDPAKKVTTTLFEVPDSVFSGPFVVDRPGNTWNAFYFISVPRVAYDENGNPYVSEVSYEVRKFDGVQMTLASTVSGWSNGFHFANSMALDVWGNLYYKMTAASTTTIYKVAAGSTSPEALLVLQEGQLGGAMSIASGVLYFVAGVPDLQVVRLYKYDLGKGILATFLERSSVVSGEGYNAGTLAYLSANLQGDVYYLYRQRGPYWDDRQWGVIELGRASSGKTPKILLNERTDFNVLAFTPGYNQMQASKAGDVFFHLASFHPLLGAEDYYVYWYNPRTGSYSSVLHDSFGFTIQIDGSDNLYFVDSQGTLARLNA